MRCEKVSPVSRDGDVSHALLLLWEWLNYSKVWSTNLHPALILALVKRHTYFPSLTRCLVKQSLCFTLLPSGSFWNLYVDASPLISAWLCVVLRSGLVFWLFLILLVLPSSSSSSSSSSHSPSLLLYLHLPRCSFQLTCFLLFIVSPSLLSFGLLSWVLWQNG